MAAGIRPPLYRLRSLPKRRLATAPLCLRTPLPLSRITPSYNAIPPGCSMWDRRPNPPRNILGNWRWN